MRLEFQLPQGPVHLLVDVLDNAGAQAWANHFGCGYETTAFISDHLYVQNFNKDEELAADHAKIVDLLSVLANMGIVYPGAAPEFFVTADPEQAHQDLNQLHRFFTTRQQCCNLNGYGKSFDHAQATQLLQHLNDVIHHAEGYLPHTPKDCPVLQLREMKLYRATHSGDPIWLDLKDYRQYHSADHYDVVLTSEILGKTILQSYLDNDNPNHWDTSGHYAAAGGLQICFNSARQQIYQSLSFRQWLACHGLESDQVIYDFPIGNITNKHSADWTTLLTFMQDGINQVDVRYYI